MLSRLFVLRGPMECKQLHAFLKANWPACAQAGKPLSVQVSEHKAKRSAEQNRLLWAVLHDIAASAWVGGKRYSADAWHEQFKREFIGCEELPSGATVGISTASLSVEEFSTYIERIREYASDELGIELAIA